MTTMFFFISIYSSFQIHALISSFQYTLIQPNETHEVSFIYNLRLIL